MGRDGRPTRDRILAESKALIYQNGFAGTSIDLILDRAGITKGAFFYHFKSKADLALALIQEFAATDQAEMNEALEATAAFAGQPQERLLRFIQAFIDLFANAKEPPNCLYASVSNEQNQYDQEIRDIVRENMLRWRQALRELIDKAMEARPPKVAVDKDALADQLTVILEGAFIVSKGLEDPRITAQQLGNLKTFFELLFTER
jgi:TetR/AcrR family transcriptional regulator, transcriptional repressor for nem operon